MKIEYNPRLYRQLAGFDINEIITVENRKNESTTIHLNNIKNLNWHELQLLEPDGADKFSKQYLLYEWYSNSVDSNVQPKRGTAFNRTEVDEICLYLDIYRSQGCRQHFEVNQIITDNRGWDHFPTIRSLNDHGEYDDIQGIQPKYFQAVCSILGIGGADGRPLDRFRPY